MIQVNKQFKIYINPQIQIEKWFNKVNKFKK